MVLAGVGLGLGGSAQAAVTTFTTVGATPYTVPAGVNELTVVATGASGGSVNNSGIVSGGKGAQVTVRVSVTPGQQLFVNVGEAGREAGPTTVGGGGAGGPGISGTVPGGGSGGGASDVRTASGDLATRLVVAAGGGGAGRTAATGGRYEQAGGGNNPGQPGTQTAGGAGGVDAFGPAGSGTFGRGGDASTLGTSGAGGGGGGYFGGGGGASGAGPGAQASGGGGSNFVIASAVKLDVRDAQGPASVTITTPEPADTTKPSCGSLVVRRATSPGGKDQADVTITDAGSGIASITNFTATNGTYSVPAFSPGAASVTLTATKTAQGTRTSFAFDVTDVAGNTTHCV